MSNKVKEVNIKSQTYYSFDDIINIKNFDSDNIKIDEKPYKNNAISYFGYFTINQRFKICKNYQYESFIPYFQQSEWML